MRCPLAGALALVASVATCSMAAAATDITPKDMGLLTIVDSFNTERELDGGGSSQTFTLRLPEGASCPGDSANDQWRIQSFLVPAAVDIEALSFGELGPAGPGEWALYGVETSPVVDQLLAQNASPGQPGLIMPFRPMTFAVYTDGVLAPGTYRLGVACTYFRALERYWHTQVVVSADPADAPAQLTWAVDPAAAGTRGAAPSESSSPSVPIVAFAVLTAVAVVVIAKRRFRRPNTKPSYQTTPIKEHA